MMLKESFELDKLQFLLICKIFANLYRMVRMVKGEKESDCSS